LAEAFLMSSKNLSRIFGQALGTSFLALLAAPTLASAKPTIGNNIYLEAKSELSLFAPKVLSNGDRALAPTVVLPEESILAIDIRQINGALEASQTNPARVNFPFVTTKKSTLIERNNKGWICGLRVVDATDEDIRETTEIDRADFCLSLEQIHEVTALETNQGPTREAFEDFVENNDRSKLDALSKAIQHNETMKSREGLLHPIADETQQIISPLRDCGAGCLLARSEFGMRNHPVLKKRRLHKGFDLRAETGSAVVSVLDGTVLANRTEYGRGKGKKGRKKTVMKGYGHYVIVVHPEANLETLYAHLSEFESSAGANVPQGTLIALSGNTGIGTAPHLHFETHVPGDNGGYVPVNPRGFIGSLLDSVAMFVNLFNLKS
jgi:murein DD-endopeptidase MepM/ murein hydrolase activator NlpD